MDDDEAAATASAPPPPRPGQVLLQRRRSTWIGWRREGGPAAPAPSVSRARGEARVHEQRTATHTHPPTLIYGSRLEGAVVKEGSRQDLTLCFSLCLCRDLCIFYFFLIFAAARRRVSRLQVTLAHLCGGTQADFNATPSCETAMHAPPLP